MRFRSFFIFILFSAVLYTVSAETSLVGSLAPQVTAAVDTTGDDVVSEPLIKTSGDFSVSTGSTSAALKLTSDISQNTITVEAEKAIVSMQVNPNFCVVAGKDRVFEGVAYAWNPVDIFNTATSTLFLNTDLSDSSSYPLFFAASMFSVVDSASFEGGTKIFPQSSVEDYIYDGYIKYSYAGNFSFEAYATCAFGYNTKPVVAGYVRAVPSFLSWVVLYGEGQYRTENSALWKAVGGIQLSPDFLFFGDKLQLQCEYYHNETSSPLIIGSRFYNYIYGAFFYNNGTLSVNAGIMVNCDADNGKMVSFQTEYRTTENRLLILKGYVPIGSNPSEFKLLTGKKWYVSVGMEYYFDVLNK